jgi:hypothetical protein
MPPRAAVLRLGVVAVALSCGPKQPPQPAPSPAAAPIVQKVDIEAVCPTADVANFQVRRGDAKGANAGEALAAARENAVEELKKAVCVGVSELRCAAVLRHVKPWREGYHDPAGGWACASVSVDRQELASLERDAAVFETQLRQLASTVAERVGKTPVQIKAPTWASGCSSGQVGQAISANLFNQLGAFPELRLVPSEDRADKAHRVVMEIAPGARTAALAARLQRAGESTFSPLPGFDFPLDLFVIDANERGDCRSDNQLGLAQGQRLGAGGLRVDVEIPGVDGEACEGQQVEPIVRVNRPADLQVYSVAKTGRSLLVWPPPGMSGRVQSQLSLGTMTAVAQPATGDERLLVVALPAGAKWTKTSGWHGFCEVPGGVGPEFYPSDAAVGTATFTVYRAGTDGCAKVPGIEAIRNQVIAPPSCPL